VTEADARTVIERALDRLYEVDRDLLGAHERSTTFRLAMHLAALVEEPGRSLRVDCEYNRATSSRDGVKRLPSLAAKSDRVYPDIIVHERNSGSANEIVVEAKFAGEHDDRLAADLAKLAAYQIDLAYQHAFLILFGQSRSECIVHRASNDPGTIEAAVQRLHVRRWRDGQTRAARRQHQLTAREGARPGQAVAEALSASAAIQATPRDPVAVRGVENVRRRWVRVQQRAKQARR
jgi:hypothetical protein